MTLNLGLLAQGLGPPSFPQQSGLHSHDLRWIDCPDALLSDPEQHSLWVASRLLFEASKGFLCPYEQYLFDARCTSRNDKSSLQVRIPDHDSVRP